MPTYFPRQNQLFQQPNSFYSPPFKITKPKPAGASSMVHGHQVLFPERDLYMSLALSKLAALKFRLVTISAADNVERISPLGSLADRKCEMNIKAPGKLKSLLISGV